jgi:hypothetical protein
MKSLVLALVLLTAFTPIIGCGASKRHIDEQTVAKIEAFKSANGRLPKSLEEVGVKEDESGPVYYCQTTTGQYLVWYGASLGESVGYNSKTKKWSDSGNPPCATPVIE